MMKREHGFLRLQQKSGRKNTEIQQGVKKFEKMLLYTLFL